MRLVTGDKCAGMLGALEEVFPGARNRRCTVHFYRTCWEGFPFSVARRKRARQNGRTIQTAPKPSSGTLKPLEKPNEKNVAFNKQIRTINGNSYNNAREHIEDRGKPSQVNEKNSPAH